MPDAATAGGSSPRLCVDRVCPGLMLSFYWWLLCWNTHSVCGLFFGKLHTQLEVLRVACFASSWIGEGAAVVNNIVQAVAVIDLRS